MLNPKVEEVYGKRTAECFQFLSNEAEKKQEFVGLWGVKSLKDVVLPRMVFFDGEDFELTDLLSNVFLNRAAGLTMYEQDALNYLPSIPDKEVWKDKECEVISLWV